MVRTASSRLASTTTLLAGLLATYVVYTVEAKDSAASIFTISAFGVGLTLCLATGIEGMAGVRTLIRVDILILWVLYALIFLEFLLPQPNVDTLVSATSAVNGTNAVLVGFAGLAIGRHLISKRTKSRQRSIFVDLPPADLFLLFVLTTLLGYLHIFLAVNFDPFEALWQMSLPRGFQSWSRGKYGDVSSLLYEAGAVIYLIPPIAGFICAHLKRYNILQKLLVLVVLLFTFYYGFSGGTRSVFATYVITFAGMYFLAKPQVNLRQILLAGLPMLAVLLVATVYMLEFRNIGISKFSFAEHEVDTLFVDQNIVIVSRLTDLFPDSYEFLGLEIPFNALIRPIPRVLWPGKPEGLSVGIEEAMGVSRMNVTVSCTFVGEAYMAGGLLAVLFISLFFGALAEMWNRVGGSKDLRFAQLLYVSGFLCAAIAMRSMLWMVTFMLPTFALWLYGKLWLRRSSVQRLPPTISPNKL
jgi:oligosaccharide repeat unit polymerase